MSRDPRLARPVRRSALYPLTHSEISQALANLPLWREQESRLTRTWTLDSFEQCISLINQVADIAVRMGHHPDIALLGHQVTLSPITHEVSAVTLRDVELATALSHLG